MKKGRWIGSLLLAVIACIARLHGEEVQWQAVGDAPRSQTTAAATLAAPQPLPSDLPKTESRRPAELPATISTGIMPVSYETIAPVNSRVAVTPPNPQRPPLEVIAVSAPVTSSSAPPAQGQDEPNEGGFAADRSFYGGVSSRFLSRTGTLAGEGSGIVQTSANVVVPAASSSQVAMIPGWEAPMDTSWGRGLPTGQFPQDPPTADLFALNPNPQRPRLYTAAEYLLWWVQGQSVPVLATTSAPSDFGVLGAPTTQILFGGNQINGNSPFSGARFTVGYWLGCDQTKALEFTGFFLGSRAAGFSTNSSLNPVIGRPFLEANTGQETAQNTSLPGVAAGTLTINAPTSLWGLAPNLLCQVCCGCNYRVSVLGGFQYLNLSESLTITENVVGLPTAPEPFTNQLITVQDSFSTRNNFYGGNLGADARWYWGRWSVDVRGQVALGVTAETLGITGGQQFIPGIPTAAGLTQHFTGGLLALPSNIGVFYHDAFSVVPMMFANVGYQVLPNLRAFFGYNFLYWSNVIRPGTSIDRVIDVTQIPNFPLHPEPAPLPGLHPAPIFHQVGLWAQGISFGFEFVY